MRDPELDTGIEVWAHQVQGDNHCPVPAGHTIAGTGQEDTIGLLGHHGHKAGSCSAAVDQHSQILHLWADFQLFPLQPAVLQGLL